MRMPPAAFTPMPGPTTRRMSATSWAVAPPGPKPVDVLTKSAPAGLGEGAGERLLGIVEQRRLDDHFDDGAAGGAPLATTARMSASTAS